MEKKKEGPVSSAFAGLLDDDDDTETIVNDEAGEAKVAEDKKDQKSTKKVDSKEPAAKKQEKKKTEKKEGAKKSSESKTKESDVVLNSSVEGKLLFEHGIDMRGGIEDELDFDTFRKIVGTAWKNELVGDSSVPQRVSVKNMEFIKLIADTNKISLTQSLNNILALTKYQFSDYFKKLQKEREQIDL